MEFDKVKLKFILNSKGVRIVDNFEDELKGRGICLNSKQGILKFLSQDDTDRPME